MPPVAVNVVDDPVHILTAEPAPMVGIALTVIVAMPVSEQPLVVPVTV